MEKKGKEDSVMDLVDYVSGVRKSSNAFQEHSRLGQKRILTDLKEIQNDNMLYMEVNLSEDSVYIWDVAFPAPNGKYVKATLHFGSQYPCLPPRIFIKQRLFHPNISMRGEVCFQGLKNIWTPAHCIWSLILSGNTHYNTLHIP